MLSVHGSPEDLMRVGHQSSILAQEQLDDVREHVLFECGPNSSSPNDPNRDDSKNLFEARTLDEQLVGTPESEGLENARSNSRTVTPDPWREQASVYGSALLGSDIDQLPSLPFESSVSALLGSDIDQQPSLSFENSESEAHEGQVKQPEDFKHYLDDVASGRELVVGGRSRRWTLVSECDSIGRVEPFEVEVTISQPDITAECPITLGPIAASELDFLAGVQFFDDEPSLRQVQPDF